MSIDRTYRCDAPECDGNWSEDAMHSCPGLLTVVGSMSSDELHFCHWDCVLKYAATMEPVETIPFGSDEPTGEGSKA